MRIPIPIKTLIVAILALLFTSPFSGCWIFRDDYHLGEHPELYSVAIHSLLGARGARNESVRQESYVRVADTDPFGRTLFFYYEGSPLNTFSLIISQKSDDNYAYFYTFHNFISMSRDEMTERRLALFPEATSSISILIDRYIASFPEEAVEEIKRLNDWDNPLDPDRLTRVKIVRNKPQGPLRSASIRRFHRQVLGYEGVQHRNSTLYFRTDDYGRSIYLGAGRHGTEGEPSIHGHVVMLFLPDGSFDVELGVMELSDLFNYQDELKEFMERNKWNMPLD